MGMPDCQDSDGTQFCSTCIQAKQRQQIPRQSPRRASHPGERIHADLVGPMNVSGYDGSSYFALFTDDVTRYRWVEPITQKLHAHEALKKVLNFVRNWADHPVTYLRLDGGREWGVTALQEYARNSGICLEISTPYSHQMNGLAERSNALVCTKARALMIPSRLPQKLWPEAVKHAVYLLNRLPTKGTGGKIPIQHAEQLISDRDENKPPEYAHLRTWGCEAWALIPPERRLKSEKFSSRSQRGYYLGSEAYNKHRLWLNGKVVSARDVRFNEDVFERQDQALGLILRWNGENSIAKRLIGAKRLNT